jgi:hypothetical protein
MAVTTEDEAHMYGFDPLLPEILISLKIEALL